MGDRGRAGVTLAQEMTRRGRPSSWRGAARDEFGVRVCLHRAAASWAGLVLAAVEAVLVASDGLRMCLACLGVSP